MKDTELTQACSAALRAWDTKDDAGLAVESARLGARIDGAAARTFEEKIAKLSKAIRKPVEHRRLIVEAVAIAARSKTAIGWRASNGSKAALCLAVRHGDRVVVDLAISTAIMTSPSSAWPALQPWHRVERDNLEPCLRWAQEPGRVVLPFVLPEEVRPAVSTDDLLAEVLAAPEDDAPRHVLADALLASGDPRGEYIALSLCRAGCLVPSRAGEALAARERALFERHKKAWLPPAVEYAKAVGYRRGFIETITVTSAAFLKHGVAMFDNAPIRGLRLELFKEASLAASLESAAGARIIELDLSQRGLQAAEVAVVARQQLPLLRALDVSATALDARALESLANAPWAERITSLSCRLDDGALEWMARANAFPRVERLAMGPGAGAGLIALLETRSLIALSARTLKCPMSALLGASGARSLVWLRVGRDGANAMAELTALAAPPPALRALTVDADRVPLVELAALLDSPTGRALVSLHFNGLALSDFVDDAAATSLGARERLRYVAISAHEAELLSPDARERLGRVATFPSGWPREDPFDGAFVARREDLLASRALKEDVSAPAPTVSAIAPPAPTKLERAADPRTPAEELLEMVGSQEADILRALAENESTPAAALDRIAERDVTAVVLARCASHRNASPALLERLSQSKLKSVRDALSYNKHASPKVLATLIERGTTPDHLASHPNITSELLDALIEIDVLLRLEVSRAPRLSAAAREKLLADPHPQVVINIIRRNDVPPETLAAFAGDERVRGDVAANARTPIETLRELASTARVDEALSTNPSAPADVLDQVLERATERRVHCQLANHPNLSRAGFDRLVALVPAYVASNPHAPSTVLEQLATTNPYLLSFIVANPACPPAVRDTALASELPEVRRAAASNKAHSTSRLEELAGRSDEHVRAGVAANPTSPAALLERLAADKCPRVWVGLAQNPARSAELTRALEALAVGGPSKLRELLKGR